MSVIDLTFDSSEDESSIFEKQNVIPFSDSNIGSGSRQRTTTRTKSKQSPVIPHSRVSSKRIAQATSNHSILDRLSKPIHFDNPVIKEETVKSESKEESSDSDSESDSDSARFLESATLFFPEIGKKTVSASVKRDSMVSLPESKRAKTTTPTPSKEKTRSTGYNWNTAPSATSNPIIYPSLVGKSTPTELPSPAQSNGKRARKSAVEALRQKIMSVFGSTGTSSSTTVTTVQKKDPPQPLYSLNPLQSSLSNPSQVLSSQITHVKTIQSKTTQPKSIQTEVTQPLSTQTKTVQAKTTQTKTTQTKPSQPKTTQPKTTPAKTTQTKTNQTKGTQAKDAPAKATQKKKSQPKPIQPKPTPTNTTQTDTSVTPTNKAQSKPNQGRSTINSSGKLNEPIPEQTDGSVSSHPSHYQLRRSTRTPVPVKDPYIQTESIQATKTVTDLRVHTIDTMLEMADTTVTGTEDRVYLEMINNCRFLQYVLKSKPSSLLTLYKRFIKTKRFIIIEPEVACETSVIESPATTPVKSKTVSPLPVKEKRKPAPVPSPYSPVSTLQSYMTLSTKSFNTFIQEESICTVVDTTRDSFIHILCSCLHTEFDYRSLNSYLVDNHCIKEQWMCEFLCDSVVNNVSIACHLPHYLMWMKKRFQLHLSFFFSFINECFELVSDLIEGHEVKRRGRKPKLDPAQIRREEEEKETLRKAHVLSVLSLLRLISSVLLDELQNYGTVVENPENWEDSLKKCIQSIWNKTTLLASYPYLWEQSKSEMVKILTLITAHQKDEILHKDFIHFIICSGNVISLSDILCISPEEQFRVDILEDIYISKRTLFSSLMKIPSICFMAKQYGFSNHSKNTSSDSLILCLVEKMKKRKNY